MKKYFGSCKACRRVRVIPARMTSVKSKSESGKICHLPSSFSSHGRRRDTKSRQSNKHQAALRDSSVAGEGETRVMQVSRLPSVARI